MSTAQSTGTTVSSRQPGQRVIRRFILKRLIGAGGMGEVWLARDEQLDQDVALKFLSSAVLHNENAVERLKRETRHNLKLTHPNIVRIYDFVQDDADAAISMEYVEGWSLWSMKVNRPHQCFTVDEIAPWIRQLCSALEYAHETAGVVHRDLKPANLLIDSRENLKVSDFGIARNLNGITGDVTAALPPLGTIGYMSPQQALGHDPSVLDDVYSLGATIYELLTGHPPFYKGEVLAQVQQLKAPSMTERLHELGVEEPAAIPLAWEETVAACLEKDPARRPQTVGAVLNGLFAAPAPEPIIHAAPIVDQSPSRNVFPVVAGLVAALIVAAAAFLWMKRGTGNSTSTAVPVPAPAAPAPVIASRIYTSADDFVVDVFHNGRRLPTSTRRMVGERFGATSEQINVEIREGDWLVFNVVNNQLRWNGAYYFGMAAVTTNGSFVFGSRLSEEWSACTDPGLVPRFIAERDSLATNLPQRLERPWTLGPESIKAHVPAFNGDGIWGPSSNRNVWLKVQAKPQKVTSAR